MSWVLAREWREHKVHSGIEVPSFSMKMYEKPRQKKKGKKGIGCDNLFSKNNNPPVLHPTEASPNYNQTIIRSLPGG